MEGTKVVQVDFLHKVIPLEDATLAKASIEVRLSKIDEALE